MGESPVHRVLTWIAMTASVALRFFVPVAIGAGLIGLPMLAAANTITFTNTGNAAEQPPVPALTIELTDDILVNNQGNFSTTCRKDALTDTYCSGIQTGPARPVPAGWLHPREQVLAAGVRRQHDLPEHAG
jgi:hypothetical protein